MRMTRQGYNAGGRLLQLTRPNTPNLSAAPLRTATVVACGTQQHSLCALCRTLSVGDNTEWLNAVLSHFLHGSTHLLPQPLCLDLCQHLGIEGLVMVIPVAAPAHATPVQDNTARHGTAASAPCKTVQTPCVSIGAWPAGVACRLKQGYAHGPDSTLTRLTAACTSDEPCRCTSLNIHAAADVISRVAATQPPDRHTCCRGEGTALSPCATWGCWFHHRSCSSRTSGAAILGHSWASWRPCCCQTLLLLLLLLRVPACA